MIKGKERWVRMAGDMMMVRSATRPQALALAGLLLLGGCVQQTVPAKPAAPPAPIPEDVLMTSFEAVTAEQVAEECPRKLRYNRAYEAAVFAAIEKKYGAEGVPDWAAGEFRPTPALERRAQAWVIDYVERRNILMSSTESWCAAGLAEIGEQTRIGKYLVAR